MTEFEVSSFAITPAFCSVRAVRPKLSFARKCDLKLDLFILRSLDDAPIYNRSKRLLLLVPTHHSGQRSMAGLSLPRCALLSDTCIEKHPGRPINDLRFPHRHLCRMNLVLAAISHAVL